MPKVSTNINLDVDLKRDCQELFSDLSRETPNADTIAALNEYSEMINHPENYKEYSSFKSMLKDVLSDA